MSAAAQAQAHLSSPFVKTFSQHLRWPECFGSSARLWVFACFLSSKPGGPGQAICWQGRVAFCSQALCCSSLWFHAKGTPSSQSPSCLHRLAALLVTFRGLLVWVSLPSRCHRWEVDAGASLSGEGGLPWDCPPAFLVPTTAHGRQTGVLTPLWAFLCWCERRGPQTVICVLRGSRDKSNHT